MSLKDFTIKFKPFIKQVEYYLQQNAPDILVMYDICKELSWDFDNTYLVFKSKRLLQNNTSKIKYSIRNVAGNVIVTLNDADFCLYNYCSDVKFNNKNKDWKPLLDKKIEHLRKLDGDLYSAFNEASDYYNIFKNYSDEYYFAFNFYEGKIKYVQLVPGLLQKFLDYESAVNNIDDETYKKYEEYCINEFKTKIKDRSNTKADAFYPIVTIPTYKTWIKDKNAEESVDNTALKLANKQCKDILDKIN